MYDTRFENKIGQGLMRIITANVNGIRAAEKKGFFDWMQKQNADVVCIQETKAQEHQLDDSMFYPEGYHCYYFDAEKKGYSGVAIYCKTKPKKVSRGLGWPHVDTEGRWIQAEFGGITVASLYLPSGSSSPERHQAKLKFMDRLSEDMKAMKRKRREFVICGDFNVVHKEIDITNWKSNQKNSGCTPEDQAWVTKTIEEVGFVDAFREVNKNAGEYTWWSNRGNARANNVGWRIDYQFVTPGLKATKASVYKESWFSDHAPLTIDYDFEIK